MLDLGKDKVAKILVQNDANVNLQNKEGNTALHVAVEKRQLKIVEILVQNLADIDIRNNNDWTPFCRARNLGNSFQFAIVFDWFQT